jgi:hypothetical protein
VQFDLIRHDFIPPINREIDQNLRVQIQIEVSSDQTRTEVMASLFSIRKIADYFLKTLTAIPPAKMITHSQSE